MRNRITLIFFLVICANTLLAQRPDFIKKKEDKKPYVFLEYYIGKDKFKERNNYFTLGFGPNFYPSLKNITNANMSVDYHYFDKKDRMWNAGYRASTNGYLAFGGAIIYLHELKFGRGLYRVEKQYWKFAGYIGPSLDYTTYYPTDTTKSIKGEKSFGVGVQFKTDFIYKPVYDFGIAVSPFVNINTVQSVVGITLSVYGSNAHIK